MSFFGNIVPGWKLFAGANRSHRAIKYDIPYVDVDIKAGATPPALDIWPDDEDTIPEWRRDQEARAAAFGYRLPNYRTAREFQSAVALCAARFMAPIAELPAPDEAAPKPTLPPDLSARLFLDWIRSRSLCGPITSDEISTLYGEFCAARGEQQYPQNIMRSRLKRLPGVTTRKNDRYLSDGRRTRQTVWLISADPIKLAVAA